MFNFVQEPTIVLLAYSLLSLFIHQLQSKLNSELNQSMNRSIDRSISESIDR